MEKPNNNLNNVEKLFASSKWKNRLRSPPFMLLSFVSGCLFSILFFYFITNYKISSRQHNFNLPSESYLQIRDEHVSLNQAVKGPKSKSQANENEALGSLKIAIEMKLNGKDEKALKLFQHAIALAPQHPEVLTHYGEFLEYRSDVVSADQLYFKALMVAPNHNKALANRKRTGRFVINC